MPLAPLLSAVIVLGACNTNPSNAELEDHPTPTILLGTWTSECQNENPKKSNSKFVVASDVISDGRLISYARLFEDEECTIASNPHIREFTVALTFTGGRTETPLGDAFHVNEKLLERKHDGKRLSMGVGTTAYDIVLVKGDRLYFGRPTSSNNGRSESTRHAELITETFYSKTD